MAVQQLNNSSKSNNFTFPSPSGPSALEWNIRVSIDVLISITSFIGNSLVLFVIYNWKKTHRTPFEILVANLSIADLAQICVYLTFSYLVKTNSDFTCKFGTSFYTTLITFSMYLLTTIAVFRCRSILHPFKRRPSIKFTYCTTAGLWILASAFVLPVCVVTIWDTSSGYCNELWPAQIYNKVYTIALFVVQYVIPLSIIAVSYIKIMLNLKQHKAPPAATDYSRKQYLMMKRKRDIEVIKISAVIVALYTILTLPNQIAWISRVVFQNVELFMIIFKFSTHLQILHNCCNPFVYGTISRQFRSKFTKAVLKCMTCNYKRNSTQTVYYTEQGRSNKSFEELAISGVVLMNVMKN